MSLCLRICSSDLTVKVGLTAHLCNLAGVDVRPGNAVEHHSAGGGHQKLENDSFPSHRSQIHTRSEPSNKAPFLWVCDPAPLPSIFLAYIHLVSTNVYFILLSSFHATSLGDIHSTSSLSSPMSQDRTLIMGSKTDLQTAGPIGHSDGKSIQPTPSQDKKSAQPTQSIKRGTMATIVDDDDRLLVRIGYTPVRLLMSNPSTHTDSM